LLEVEHILTSLKGINTKRIFSREVKIRSESQSRLESCMWGRNHSFKTHRSEEELQNKLKAV
jgi:hypothetical protein